MRKRAALHLLDLEDRLAPATFTVTTTADSGAGSLRAAIASANGAAGLDTINFAIATGAQTIALASALPSITDPVVIDGTSQSGFAGVPLIRLSGAGAGAGANGLNFVNHTGSTIKSLVIGGFSGAGVRFSGGGSHTLHGSFIGTNAAGAAADGNGVGVRLDNASLGSAVGGNGANQRNVISGNLGAGVRIDNSYGNLVAGNFLGANAGGSAAVANAGGGVSLVNGAAGNTIGGVSAGLGNVISGNATSGVALEGGATSGNVIVGNRIGLSFAGTALANAGPGVKAFNAAGSTPPGGTVAGSENVVRANTIAQNAGAGVAVLDISRQVRIDANSIRDNGGPGIQRDASANDGLGAPNIASIKAVTGGQNVHGAFAGRAGTKYQVNVFTNSVADASGFGEGQTQVGTVTVTTDAGGSGAFAFLIPTGTAGSFVSATVTHLELGDTSSFSNAFVRPDSILSPATFAVGGGAGGSPTVLLTEPLGSVARTSTVFGAGFTGGVRVAMGDLTNDGIPDLAVGTGVGVQAEVSVYNGSTQQLLFTLRPFGEFARGVFVAMGDLNNDGVADLVITPDEGGGPRVRVFNGKTFTQIADFFGIEDVNFRGGARAAIGDLTGDGIGDIAVSAGFGGGPRIAVFDGARLGPNGGPKAFGDFFGFEPSLRNGAFVALGDVNADGFADLILAAGPGGAPRVRILSGKTLTQSNGTIQTAMADFFSGDVTGRGGVRVLSRDLNGDGKADLVTGAADGSKIIVYSGNQLMNGATNPASSFDLMAARDGGMFVG